MSWQDDMMIEQAQADALNYMGEVEWRDTYDKKARAKEYYTKYWAEHRAEISKKRKERYKVNRERILERNKRYIENNREKWNAYQREYRKKKQAAIDMLKEN